MVEMISIEFLSMVSIGLMASLILILNLVAWLSLRRDRTSKRYSDERDICNRIVNMMDKAYMDLISRAVNQMVYGNIRFWSHIVRFQRYHRDYAIPKWLFKIEYRDYAIPNWFFNNGGEG